MTLQERITAVLAEFVIQDTMQNRAALERHFTEAAAEDFAAKVRAMLDEASAEGEQD